MVRPDDRPTRRRDLEVVRSGGEVVLVDGAGTEICRLNDTAFALWQLCDGMTTVAEMSIAVRDASGVGAQAAARDVASALDALTQSGALA